MRARRVSESRVSLRAVPIAALLVTSITVLLIAGTPASAQPDKPRSEIPFRKEPLPGFDGERWALGVLVALGVGGGALLWLRRRLPGALPGAWPGLLPAARERRMRLIESLRVSPRTTLLLVEVDGRALLLGDHAGDLVLLSPPAELRHD